MDQSSEAVARVSPKYCITPSGIIKIVETICSIITFSCATAVSDQYYYHPNKRGYAYVSFASFSGFFMALLTLAYHFIISGNWTVLALTELIFYALWVIVYMIAGIVAACFSASIGDDWRLHNVGAAAASFAFFCMCLWAADTAIQIYYVRQRFTTSSTASGNTAAPAQQGGSSGTKYEGKPEY